MRVAVIGTGVLGRAVAERLTVSGHAVAVYNRTRERADALRRFGVVVASSPADAMMQSDCALLWLADAPALRSGVESGHQAGPPRANPHSNGHYRS